MERWSKVKIRELLENNNTMLYRSIVKLYSYQTPDEKLFGNATEHNGMGFNRIDVEFLSSLAEWIISGKPLTQKQIIQSRKRMLKYTGQLTKIANMEKMKGVIE